MKQGLKKKEGEMQFWLVMHSILEKNPRIEVHNIFNLKLQFCFLLQPRIQCSRCCQDSEESIITKVPGYRLEVKSLLSKRIEP